MSEIVSEKRLCNYPTKSGSFGLCGNDCVPGTDRCWRHTDGYQTPRKRLEAENAMLKEELRVGNHLLAVATDQQRDLEVANAKLKELLREYGRHCEGCIAVYGFPCRCNWDEERKVLDETQNSE